MEMQTIKRIKPQKPAKNALPELKLKMLTAWKITENGKFSVVPDAKAFKSALMEEGSNDNAKKKAGRIAKGKMY
jgi:hypothetical protein